MPWLSFYSPLGVLTLTEEDGALVSLDWGQGPPSPSSPLLDTAKSQIDEYFDGVRTSFDLPINPRGTPFQKKVWQILQSIPYGTVQSYATVACKVGSVARAVGGACGRNPLPLLIPCHRVVAANGALTGYSAMDGLETKKYLIDLERER